MKAIKNCILLFIFLGGSLISFFAGAQNNDGFTSNSNGSEKKETSTSTTAGNTPSCQGIKLNTNVPFVGDCIETKAGSETTQLNAFPKLMGGMMKFLMTIILVMSLLMIVAGGVLMTTGGRKKGNYETGKEIITKVAYGIAILGASGVILKLINPNFFV